MSDTYKDQFRRLIAQGRGYDAAWLRRRIMQHHWREWSKAMRRGEDMRARYHRALARSVDDR